MVKQFKYIFVIMTATYFLFAGTGYNISNICCNNFKLNSCAIFKSKHKPNNFLSCKKINGYGQKQVNTCALTGKNKTCIFIRVFVDTPIVNVINLHNLVSPKNIDLEYIKSMLLLNYQRMNCVNIFKPTEAEFVFSGRELLALKAVLRI